MSTFHTAPYPSHPAAPLIQRAREHWPALSLAGVLAILLVIALLLIGANEFASRSEPSHARQLTALRTQVRALSTQLTQTRATDTQTAHALGTSQAELRAQRAALTRTRAELAVAHGCAHSPRARACLRKALR